MNTPQRGIYIAAARDVFPRLTPFFNATTVMSLTCSLKTSTCAGSPSDGIASPSSSRRYNSNRGIGIWQRVAGPSGGAIANIIVRNARISTRYMFGSPWWGSGEAIVVTSIPDNPEQMAAGLPGIHNVTFQDIAAVSEGGSLFSSRGQATTNPRAIDGLVLRNVSLRIVGAGGGAPVHNQLDFRPVDAGGGSNSTEAALVSGLTFEHVAGASVTGGSSVTFVAPEQSYWAGQGGRGNCLVVTADANVTVDSSFSCELALAFVVQV